MNQVNKRKDEVTFWAIDWALSMAVGDVLAAQLDVSVSGALLLTELQIIGTVANATTVKLLANASTGVGRVKLLQHTTSGEKLGETVAVIISSQ